MRHIVPLLKLEAMLLCISQGIIFKCAATSLPWPFYENLCKRINTLEDEDTSFILLEH